MLQEYTYREAIREALILLLERDDKILVMGEDVGHYGGSYAVTKGLLDMFGPERIRDCPLSESGFVGAGVGLALGGYLPIVEIMTVNFSLLALDQIVNNAATMCYMSGGQFNVPLVIRMATGAGKQLAAQHSHSLEGWYAHVPGIKVLAPSSVQDAYHCLLAAIEDPNPVILFEHVLLYGLRGSLNQHESGSLFSSNVLRSGSDISIFSYGYGTCRSIAAADELERQGIRAEVVDLRCLRPLDIDGILKSVARTNRALIVDEGWKTVGLSAEITSIISEQGFYDLDAPVARVCCEEVPMPYAAHMEEAALPSLEKIVKAAIEVVNA
jgi:pyruvate dehydrogenase E1 component beta subunit